jgi:ArsR family transcriptional regulator
MVVEASGVGCGDVAGAADLADAVGVAEAAALLGVVADPNRLTILSVLSGGTRCVCDLQRSVPIAANLLSYHLKVLRDAGLITAARRGRWIDYTLAPDAAARLHATLPPTSTCPGGPEVES